MKFTLLYLTLQVFLVSQGSCYHLLHMNSGNNLGMDFRSPRWYRQGDGDARRVNSPLITNTPLTSNDTRRMPLFTMDNGLLFPESIMPMHIFAMKFRYACIKPLGSLKPCIFSILTTLTDRW